MPLKNIVRLGVKAATNIGDYYNDLSLSPGSASMEISDKIEAAGRIWTTKLTAKMVYDNDLLREPCILRVRTTDAVYTIGSADLPARIVTKEEHLITISLEYRSKVKPSERKKVLSIAPDCE